MVEGQISFELKNNLSELEKLGKYVVEFARSLGISHKTIFQLKFSMEEIFVNIISYGYPDQEEHWIKVLIAHENSMLIMRIEDDGIPYNPLNSEPPDVGTPIENRKIGGLGIHLTKHLITDMAYSRCGDRNILVLKKDLSC